MDVRKGLSKHKYCTMIFFANLLVLLFAVSVIIVQEINASKHYLSSSFNNFNRAVQNVGRINVEDARQVQAVIDKSLTFNHPISLIENTKIFENNDKGIFGFNYDENTLSSAHGTLYGIAPIPEKLKTGQERFLILDKIWSYYKDETFFDQHFYVSYKYNYIYTSKIYSDLENDFSINSTTFDPKAKRRGIESIYQDELQEHGYFFTLPVLANENTSTIEVISPIYKDAGLVGDLGVRFDTKALANILSIYPDIKETIRISLVMRNSGQVVSINEAPNFWWSAFKYKYEIENLGTIVADYDVMFFVHKVFSGVVILFMVILLLNALIYIRRQSRLEKRELRAELVTEPMTGLYNRRIIDSIAMKVVRRAQHDGEPVSMISFDAVKFKHINDTYGHQVGDEAILHIANKLKKNVRANDFCIRMGGDEFLIIMPGVSMSKAQEITQKIKTDISTNPIPGHDVYVNVTCAVSTFEKGESFDDVFKRADDILYRNKKA